jgi:hypothetical protein
MEAKELMIGDWVECVDSTHKKKVYAQIDAIEEGQTCILVRLDNCNWFLDVSFIKPIPLTREILEKNGWIYNNEEEKFFPQTWVGGGLMLQGAGDCGYCIVVTSDYDDEDTNDTPFIILYVHELQHALRLRRIKKEIIL